MRTVLVTDDRVRPLLLAMLLWAIHSSGIAFELAPKAQLFVADFPLGSTRGAANPNVLLPPDEAFKLSVIVADSRTIVAEFMPADGYYLYRDKFAFRVREPADVKVTSIEVPPGEIKDDPFFGKTEIFHNRVHAVVRLKRASAGAIVLNVEYQGCNDRIGVCYPPIEKRIRLELPAPTNLR